MMRAVDAEINKIKDRLLQDQANDGSWNYPFVTGISTDCYMIILLRSLEINDEELIVRLVERITSKQEPNGAWKLFYDEGDGNTTATVEAYYSLLYSGYLDKNDPVMQKARRFIRENGGISEVHMFTKIMLAMTGQYQWPRFPVSVKLMLLPTSFPINLYDFSNFGRSNIVPVLILADLKFSRRTNRSPDLSDLFLRAEDRYTEEDFFIKDETRSVFSAINQGIQALKGIPGHLHSTAMDRAEKYIIDRIEPDGTFFSYFSSTFLMIFALLARGYSVADPLITRGVDGMKSMICELDGHVHCQYTTASVWNTALISYALQESGIPHSSDVIESANRYLLSRQHYKYGDWGIHSPNLLPGGWGFSNINTFNPDIDDTTAALRAIRALAVERRNERQAWDRAVRWLVSIQNDDGGWAAFEKNVNKSLLNLLPVEGGKDLLTDPSTADLTGRTLEFFGNYTHLDRNHPMIKRGINWLSRAQKKDGSWVGRWGVYIYGTWAAITGLLAVGVSPKHSVTQKGLKWLRDIQNADGGWGESARSDIVDRYMPLEVSTRAHTAWALDTLIVAAAEPTPEIERGIKFLVEGNPQEWTVSYPKGRGMAGAFYLDYHSYEHVFPLLALAHYRRKFS